MIARCILVDDEPLAREVLEKYIADCPLIELACSCHSAFEAIDVLKSQEIELVFLDINLPKLSGISMIRAMDHAPQVVFTTAYPEYAVEGFELDAVDYLVKPFSFERFMKAVNKALDRLKMNDLKMKDEGVQDPVTYLMVKSGGRLFRVDFGSISYLEAYGDYVRIHSEEGLLTTYDTLKNLERYLPAERFMRVHRSYIIAVDKIRYIEGNRIRIGEQDIPVAATYREALIDVLDKRSSSPE